MNLSGDLRSYYAERPDLFRSVLAFNCMPAAYAMPERAAHICGMETDHFVQLLRKEGGVAALSRRLIALLPGLASVDFDFRPPLSRLALRSAGEMMRVFKVAGLILARSKLASLLDGASLRQLANESGVGIEDIAHALQSGEQSDALEAFGSVENLSLAQIVSDCFSAWMIAQSAAIRDRAVLKFHESEQPVSCSHFRQSLLAVELAAGSLGMGYDDG
ncbi:hypothetical protein [Aestuariispira insulae]|uniref:Uncharacterized protein n=1 Tax=Aestuariispira insulae TaxID=1461337 RepID=A0A3D9H3E8_9PROT|nr:hypothetical protein [Aestuariispira insulae]RED43731.1 hypothetical protein DFP90_12015 [Aestuariispira insulae]